MFCLLLKLPAPRCRESSRQGKGLFVVVRSLTHAASRGECARYSCSTKDSRLYYRRAFSIDKLLLFFKIYTISKILNLETVRKTVFVKETPKTKQELLLEMEGLRKKLNAAEHRIRGLTNQKQSKEALKISELGMRGSFGPARDGILIVDAETGQISDVNPFL